MATTISPDVSVPTNTLSEEELRRIDPIQ